MKHNIVFEKNKYYATYRFYNTTRKIIRTVGFQLLYNQLVYNGLRLSYEVNNYKIIFQLKKISFEFEKKCLSKKSYFKMSKNYHFKQKFTIL